jgi:hypothetical protein
MEGHCEVLSLRFHDRAPYGAFVMLERRAVKVACVVLRGLGEGDLAWLPGGLPSWSHVESRSDQGGSRLKEEVGWLKLIFGALIAIGVSLLG